VIDYDYEDDYDYERGDAEQLRNGLVEKKG